MARFVFQSPFAKTENGAPLRREETVPGGQQNGEQGKKGKGKTPYSAPARCLIPILSYFIFLDTQSIYLPADEKTRAQLGPQIIDK